jgi:hypothetical protein
MFNLLPEVDDGLYLVGRDDLGLLDSLLNLLQEGVHARYGIARSGIKEGSDHTDDDLGLSI